MAKWQPTAPELSGTDKNLPWLLIHFWAEWNLIDRDMDRQLQEITASSDLALRSCNIDNPDRREFIKSCEVGNIPALSLLSHGKHLSTRIGMGDHLSTQKWVENLLPI